MKELFESSYLSVMSEEITRLREENKQLKNIIKELEEWLNHKHNDYKVLYKMYGNPYFMIEEYEKILKKVQDLKKKYKLGGNNE